LALSMQRYAQFDDQAGVLEMLRRDLRASVIAGQRTALADDAASATSANAAASKPAPIEHAIETVDQLAQKAARDAAIPTPVLRAWLANRLDFYFPLVSQVDHSLVPGFVALIAVFLPFLLASGALVREREAGTLETMILAARRNWVCMAAGKLILPVSVTMLSVLLLLVAARTAFGFGIKPGFLQALGIQLLAGVVSAVFGLSVSTLIKSSQDAYTTSSAYLVACILITGLIYPVEQAANAVAAVSYLFPLTLAAPALEGWMVNGANVTVESWRWYGLIGQLAAAVALCGLAVQRLRKSL
jgi:ABC-type multidrug transport system permease subunit